MPTKDKDNLDPMEDTNRFAAGREDGDMEGNENDISDEERALLDASFEDEEEQGLHDAELDDRDDDGTLLNEKTSANSKMGEDLDVPGSGDDDADEAIGEEDEENNSYSLDKQEDDDNG